MELRELIQSINIVEYISQFVDLTQRNDEWWGISPFTFPPERTPSFSVRENPPFFFDYSSGASGNIFHFVKRYYNCSSSEAVEHLKAYAGYDGSISEKSGVMDAVKVFKRFAHRDQYIKKSSKTVLQDDYMDKYEYRRDKLSTWTDEGISEDSLKKFQVKYDSFSDRIVYPIRDMNGKIVNIGGRALAPHWKEEGQNKYCYFYKWGTINTIYGVPENMDAIKKEHEVILFEGCKSVLIADTWGVHNTGALLTSHLSANQMKILAKLGCDVVFALDKDVYIRNDKNIRKLSQYVNVFYLFDRYKRLDNKDSPVDRGKEVFKELYDNRLRLRI